MAWPWYGAFDPFQSSYSGGLGMMPWQMPQAPQMPQTPWGQSPWSMPTGQPWGGMMPPNQGIPYSGNQAQQNPALLPPGAAPWGSSSGSTSVGMPGMSGQGAAQGMSGQSQGGPWWSSTGTGTFPGQGTPWWSSTGMPPGQGGGGNPFAAPTGIPFNRGV
jgi:hypothetical protein